MLTRAKFYFRWKLYTSRDSFRFNLSVIVFFARKAKGNRKEYLVEREE